MIGDDGLHRHADHWLFDVLAGGCQNGIPAWWAQAMMSLRRWQNARSVRLTGRPGVEVDGVAGIAEVLDMREALSMR